jgi:hypothetical protein
MGGGKGILILISTSAMVEIGTTIANAKRIVHKSNFFISLPPLYDHSNVKIHHRELREMSL